MEAQPNQQPDEGGEQIGAREQEKVNLALAEMASAVSDVNPSVDQMRERLRRIRELLRASLEFTPFEVMSEEEKDKIMKEQHEKFLKFVREHKMEGDGLEVQAGSSTKSSAEVGEGEATTNEK